MRHGLSHRLLWAAALATGAGPAAIARAEDSVTLFGLIDTYTSRIWPGGGAPLTMMGNSGLLASRLALRGREDLGDGYRASFLLENGINSDDGAQADAHRMWNRQAWLAISGAPGELRLGRQNTPQFFMNGKYDAFISSTQASGWNNMVGTQPRVDGALSYITPNMAGLTLQAMLSRGAAGGATPVEQTPADQSLHLAAEYLRGDCYLGSNYESAVVAGGPGRARRTSAGGNCALDGNWTLYGAAGREIRATASNDTSLDTMLYTVSLRYRPDALNSWSLGRTVLHDRLTGVGHGGAGQWGALYQYFFSLRTSVYAAAADLRQRGQRHNFLLEGAPAALGQPGGTLRGTQLGILHTF